MIVSVLCVVVSKSTGVVLNEGSGGGGGEGGGGSNGTTGTVAYVVVMWTA